LKNVRNSRDPSKENQDSKGRKKKKEEGGKWEEKKKKFKKGRQWK